jgi:glucose-6-phosphate dehydrogenase assembly protein OpcA
VTVSLTDTTSAEISAALLKARHNAGSPSLGMVLTLIIVCNEKEYADALEASSRAGREHPARILLCVRSRGRKSSLDAEVGLGEGTPGEVVVLRMRGTVSEHPASVIRPLLLPDSPVVIWWPGEAPDDAGDELGRLAVRRLTDAAAVPRPHAALLDRARAYVPGDTDLAWTRLTRWRGLLAAALDQYPSKVKSAVVESERDNPSADLLGAWLQTRLKVPVKIETSDGPGITAARLTTANGDIAITRPDGRLASYTVPGQPERLVALKRREATDLISEELRRLDDDHVYEATVKALLKKSTKKATRSARKKAN